MSYQRIDRISEEVRREVDAIIREEVNDPRVAGTFSITRAEVTRDLRYAKIYVSVLDKSQEKDVLKGLKSAGGFLRRELGSALGLRYTPELLFEADDSIAYGAHILEVMQGVERADAQRRAEHPEPGPEED